MFDYKDFYKERNELFSNKYKELLNQVENVYSTDKNSFTGDKDFLDLLKDISQLILSFTDFEKRVDKKYFHINTFEELRSQINGFYKTIEAANYSESYINPDFATKIFGEEIGKLVYPFYSTFFSFKNTIFKHQIFKLIEPLELFAKVFEYAKSVTKITYNGFFALLKDYYNNLNKDNMLIDMQASLDPDISYFRDIVTESNLEDLRYLFMYNSYISSNEVKTAEFFLSLPDEDIEKLSKQIVKGYSDGFTLSNKSLKDKKTVNIRYNIGQEKLLKAIVLELRKTLKLEAILVPAFYNLNKQYVHDFKFAQALYFDEEFSKNYLAVYDELMLKLEPLSQSLSGIILIDKFGDLPFSPKNKKSIWEFTPKQQKIYQSYNSQMMQIREKYMPRSKQSFAIIAFPSPEIGDNFENIFADIIKINMLDSAHYHKIQQNIINVLDKADFVHVKGKNGNRTDVKVKMQPLVDKRKMSNFVNCGADVNIPVGEVFTSPMLEGTNGILHVKSTYLAGLNYEDFFIEFKDGFVENYGCKNYDDDEANRNYIAKNLLFPHKTLPLGEFAIGTNTLAYAVANKHDILNILPILIVEKMGPHFAIGDTCFSQSEDIPFYNPLDKKEVTARDNSKSILRKEDISKAYTFRHTDITLPYNEIDFIVAIDENGKEYDIIRDGFFAVKGTEELNEPLREMLDWNNI